jgi:hypothetical protein
MVTMRTARLSYRLGILATCVMAATALTAAWWGSARTEDIQAHATFAGLGATGAIVAHRHYGTHHALWAFFLPACISLPAGVRGLPVVWGFLAGYAVAGGLGLWAVWVPRGAGRRRSQIILEPSPRPAGPTGQPEHRTQHDDR